MLETIQFAVQHANPYVIEALTKVHGVYMNVYDKKAPNTYDEGRDNYISNTGKYDIEPTYKRAKLLLYDPVQETFGSGRESFDTYINDIYILTCSRKYNFKKEQKFEIFYNRKAKVPQRVMQCFEVKEISNSFNEWSIRKVMLKPFN
jgi:hypothetical protein